MVRRWPLALGAWSSSPHARGDGPPTRPRPSRKIPFSPRTWGWSAALNLPKPFWMVLPTHVGMVREANTTARTRQGSPHARGDGPVRIGRDLDLTPFSPRTWGWSVRPHRVRSQRDVLPTHVGMVRWQQHRARRWMRSPHARGDGPPEQDGEAGRPEFSPRTWGWSGAHDRLTGRRLVLPTHVGMVRRIRRDGRRRSSSPHARGDGPLPGASHSARSGFSPRTWGWSGARGATAVPIEFSPRTWGWSAVPGQRQGTHDVLPTHVGMVRHGEVQHRSTVGSPHARGDGPLRESVILYPYRFSPRTWGWSERGLGLASRREVLPTHVGMVRSPATRTTRCCCSPHARGDGPPRLPG